MRPEIDLALLKEKISDLAETPYFDTNVKTFLAKLKEVIYHVQENTNNYNAGVVRMFIEQLWSTQKYLAGTTSNEVPYEIQICLSAAIREWIQESCIFTTALIEEKNFHLRQGDIWQFISKGITGYETGDYNPILIQIALPKLYQYKPLYCIALYHELGHFLDIRFKVTETTLLLNPPDFTVCPKGVTHQQWLAINQNHRREHFADLFASCYCGESIGHSLELIAPGAKGSFTHPPTNNRVKVISDFLSQNQNSFVDLFQAALQMLKKPPLVERFDKLDLSKEFDDARPVQISSGREMHGIFPSAWEYLEECLQKWDKDWIVAETEAVQIETIVNNLVEKSIRNFDIKSRWNDVAVT